MEKAGELVYQLQINIVKKNFEPIQILKNLVLNIEAGESISVLGPSGVGKTTFLKILAGLDNNYQGEIYLDGKKIIEPSYDISMMFQGHRLLPWLTVRENVRFINSKVSDDEIQEYLKNVGISEKAKMWPNQLSSGERTRVGLSVALINSSKILLLDEPLTDVDIKVKTGVINLLKKIRKQFGTTTILTTHNIEDALSLTERVIVLKGSPASIVFESKIESDTKADVFEEIKDILMA